MSDQPTKAPPRVVEGVTFRCYHTSTGHYAWRTDSGRITLDQNFNMTYWHASINGKIMRRKFKRFDTAAAGALREFRETETGAEGSDG
jgi:hypothetical protein